MMQSLDQPLSLPADEKAIEAFTRRLATALELGVIYPYPTKIFNPDGTSPDWVWCADGWTAEGLSVELVVEPDKLSLSFGRTLRPRSLRVALKDALSGGDRRREHFRLDDWRPRLLAALAAQQRS